jgi:glucokinase
MNHCHLGLDLGGTKFSGMVLNAHGKEIAFHEVPVRKTWNARQLRALLESLTHDLVERANVRPRLIRSIGIGVPGVVDEKGHVQKIANLPALKRTNLRNLLPRVTTSVWNDAVCAANAESVLGNLAPSKNGIHLTLGTGVGSALVTRTSESGTFGRRILTQITNLEMGQTGVNIDAAISGMRTAEPYEMEAYCSRKFFVRNAKKRVRVLYQEAMNGDEDAKQLFARYGANLGVLLANADTLFRPDTIILSGGMTASFPAYRHAMEAVFHARRFLLGKPPAIKLSAFGREGGALGAALYGMLK